MTAVQITIPTVLAVVAVAMCFFRRMPACMVAFAAYIAAAILGVVSESLSQYLIWGLIALIDTVNIYATRLRPAREMQLYTATGCFVGCFLGAVVGSIVAVSVAGAFGAALGFLAYTRTPRGRANSDSLARRLSLFAECACTPWFTLVLVAFVMAAIFA